MCGDHVTRPLPIHICWPAGISGVEVLHTVRVGPLEYLITGTVGATFVTLLIMRPAWTDRIKIRYCFFVAIPGLNFLNKPRRRRPPRFTASTLLLGYPVHRAVGILRPLRIHEQATPKKL
jgi:hypothetical protein